MEQPLKFGSATTEVWEWISNFTPHNTMNVITYPCYYYNWIMLKCKRTPGVLPLANDAWLLASPAHQQPKYWLCHSISESFAFRGKCFNDLYNLCTCWEMPEDANMFPKLNSSRQGLIRIKSMLVLLIWYHLSTNISRQFYTIPKNMGDIIRPLTVMNHHTHILHFSSI